jgi:hypothetical protein
MLPKTASNPTMVNVTGVYLLFSKRTAEMRDMIPSTSGAENLPGVDFRTGRTA